MSRARLFVTYRYHTRIIAASVTRRGIAEIPNPDRNALRRLITKGAV
jgi:hypothetical protein